VREVFVPVDFSQGSRVALERALELGRALGADVRVVHIVDTSALLVTGVDAYIDIHGLANQLREGAKRELAALVDAVDPARERIRGVDVIEGRPVQAIVDVARERHARMIVMGTHGRTGIQRLVLGSVAERVVRLAPCDVLVVHLGASAAEPRKA
jgi:nucleotide-binding universal stress UspA family protein